MKTKTQPKLLMLELLFKLCPPYLNQPPHYVAHTLGTRWYVLGGRVSKDISASVTEILADINFTCSTLGVTFAQCTGCRNYFVSAGLIRSSKMRAGGRSTAHQVAAHLFHLPLESEAVANTSATGQKDLRRSARRYPFPSLDSIAQVHELVARFRRSI